MLPLVNVPPELQEKMKALQEKCTLECMEVMDRNLEGKMVMVAIAVYYETMIRLLMGMADELERVMHTTPDQTAELIIGFVTKGVNLCRDSVKMDSQATNKEEGHA